jgi:hypothetical protein
VAVREAATKEVVADSAVIEVDVVVDSEAVAVV